MKMKALHFFEHGGPAVLQYGTIEQPVPDSRSALIKVHYAGLNHLDIWVRRGWKGLTLTFPHVTGSDLVGEVVSLPPAHTSEFIPGDMVLVNPGYSLFEDEWTARGEENVSPGFRVLGEHISGGLAEFVAVPLTCLHRAPTGVPLPTLAAMPVVAQTCWRMLRKLRHITADHSVLIVGSGGGVNSLSLQLCHSFGARVFVLAGSTAKAARARELGAQHTIVYTDTPDWHKEILKITDGRGVDVVIDNAGARTFTKSLKSLCPGGTLLTVGNTTGPELTLDNRLIFGKQLQILGSTMGSRSDFSDAISYLCQNALYPVIDRVAPLSEGIAELNRLEAGEQFGKIVLDCLR